MDHKIRINMHDDFSKRTASIEKIVSDEKLKRLEHIQINGIVIEQFENDINYNWIIDEIELLTEL